MGANKPQQTKWRTATEEAPVVEQTDGDSFQPLRKLVDKYLAKA